MGKNQKIISPFTLSELLKESNIQLHRITRCEEMRKVLEPQYAAEISYLEKKNNQDSDLLSITEKVRLIRIKSYMKLSEFQLENDFYYYNESKLVKRYILGLQDYVLESLTRKLGEEKLKELIKESENKYDISSISAFEYNAVYAQNMIEDDEYFDGVYYMDAINHFNETAVTKEIVALGKKYGIKLPKYWTKDELQQKLIAYHSAKGEIDLSLQTEIAGYNLKQIKAKLAEVGIKSNNHTKKSSMIDYIIRTMTKNTFEEDEVSNIEIATLDVKDLEKKVEYSGNDYSRYFQEIIKNQEKMNLYLQQLNGKTANEEPQLQRVLTITVFLLIIFVSIMWTIYGVNTFFL